MLIFKKIFYLVKSSLIIILTTFFLTLFIDFFFGKAILNKLDPYLSNTEFYNRLVRIDHKYYHHTLKANVEYLKSPAFNNYHTLCTDNHGFKYKCGVQRSKNFDVAFLGDSFVEGVALNYEDTFVGIFEKNKKLSVANLGVTSYAPNIYLSKIKYLLENQYTFEELILFIDVGDLYDDNTFYKLNDDFSVGEKKAKEKNLKRRKFLRNNFPITNYYMYVIKMNNRLNNSVPPLKSEKPIFDEKAILKSKWTYESGNKIEGYDEPISKTKLEMIYSINELYKLLKANNIKLSLVVYPWPQSLKFDKINSDHVMMWKKFCEGKCHKFLNLFPFFFNEMRKSSYLEVYRKYYFWNDVHFNSDGNKKIAYKLIEEF